MYQASELRGKGESILPLFQARELSGKWESILPLFQARELRGKGESILPLFLDFSVRLWNCSDRMVLFAFHFIAADLLSNAIRSIQKSAKLVCLVHLNLLAHVDI